MALSARLNLRQAQTMTMTPQLLQSIRLLQLTHLELSRFIDEQIEQNPLLDRADDQADGPSAEGDAGRNQNSDEAAVDQHSSMAEMTTQSMADAFDTPMDNVFPDDNERVERTNQRLEATSDPALPFGSGEGIGSDIEDYVAGQVSLRDHVLEQVGLVVFDPSERLIASELIDALDERGYVDIKLSEMAARLSADPQDIEAVLSKLQQCEPVGLFARNLAECLKLQCARADRLDPAMDALLDNLELLARRDFKTLRRICGVDEADLIEMLQEIQRLDPHPASAFDAASTQTLIHDVSVTEAADGSWRIELNPEALPRVLVNRDYHATLSRSVMSGEEKTFIADCFSSASWLERSLEQRAQTILKVTTEIVRQQDAFLVQGVRALKPMTMRMVADEIGMHESTISRVASNKYVMTPRGLFELRFFFTVALPATAGAIDGEAHSSQAVRQRIRDMIDAETPEAVLSDDAIVERLTNDGVDIARRTVAKYREQMGLASSVQRRREIRARLQAAE